MSIILPNNLHIENFISKTVYSICYPETKLILEALFNDKHIPDLFTQTWSKKQDRMHQEFVQSWKRFVQPNIFHIEDFSYFYPTAGSSEALRETIVYLHSQGKKLAVFEGEYEGYVMYARAINMPIIQLNRFDLNNELNRLDNSCVFFISEPSSLDGNHFFSLNDFIISLKDIQVDAYIDFTYIGTTHIPYHINLNHSNIKAIFFSLSKVFGTYYHRIGGILTKEENPLLYGNIWFKNILSLKYGTKLLNNMPDIYSQALFVKPYQELAIQLLNNHYGLHIVPSDVVLLASIKEEELQSVLPEISMFKRQSNTDDIRICLSPLIEKIIYNNM